MLYKFASKMFFLWFIDNFYFLLWFQCKSLAFIFFNIVKFFTALWDLLEKNIFSENTLSTPSTDDDDC